MNDNENKMFKESIYKIEIKDCLSKIRANLKQTERELDLLERILKLNKDIIYNEEYNGFYEMVVDFKKALQLMIYWNVDEINLETLEKALLEVIE